MHSHTNKQTHRAYDAGPSVWEKPLCLIQPQQGIKSTLCACVMGGFAGLDRGLDINVGSVPPLIHRRQTSHVYILPVLNMILLFIILFHCFLSEDFFLMKTENALGISFASPSYILSQEFYICSGIFRLVTA